MFVRNAQGVRCITPGTYKPLLTAHIAVSVGWLGVVLAKLVLALVAATSDDPDRGAALLVALDVINLTFAPVAIATIVTGVLLSLGTKWGLLDHWWVAAKLVLTVGVIGTAVQLAPRLLDANADVPEATLLGRPWPATIILLFATAHLSMLAAATVISVFKPWGKTPLAGRSLLVSLRRASVEEAA